MKREEKNIFLKIENIKKVYQCPNGETVEALKGVSIDIREGEVLGILGANGAGKTTLSSLIVTLFSPTSGRILYKGEPVANDLHGYRRLIGYCPQKANLYARMTIGENLFYAGKFFGMSDQEVNARLKFLVERYSLEKYINRHMDELSGGYKQRVSIARALIHSPKLILFDEPTVGLDPHIRRQLWQEIESLKNDGVAVVLTTHYLDEAEFLSDYVYFVDKGSIKVHGSPADLKNIYNKSSLEEVMIKLMEEEVSP